MVVAHYKAVDTAYTSVTTLCILPGYLLNEVQILYSAVTFILGAALMNFGDI